MEGTDRHQETTTIEKMKRSSLTLSGTAKSRMKTGSLESWNPPEVPDPCDLSTGSKRDLIGRASCEVNGARANKDARGFQWYVSRPAFALRSKVLTIYIGSREIRHRLVPAAAELFAQATTARHIPQASLQTTMTTVPLSKAMAVSQACRLLRTFPLP